MAAAWPIQAHAAVYAFNFSGPGVGGTLNLSYEPNPNVGPLPQTAPNPVDPVGSFIITGLSGTYSDAALGISNVAVTGLVPLNRVSPEPSNLLAPNSFSLLPVSNGVASPGGHLTIRSRAASSTSTASLSRSLEVTPSTFGATERCPGRGSTTGWLLPMESTCSIIPAGLPSQRCRSLRPGL
jgi:hypothetical protein